MAAAETATEPVNSLQTETGEGGLTLEWMLSGGGMEDGLVERLALRGALEELPQREREVLLLRQMQGLSYQEIGAALSLEEGTVKSRISRAKRQLRTILAEGNLLGEPDVIQDRRGAGE